MDAELRRLADQLFGAPLPARPADPGGPPDAAIPAGDAPADVALASAATAVFAAPYLTRRQLKRLWEHVAAIDNFWESLREIEPGMVARLAAIAADRRWEIIFLTRRPESAGATAQTQSQRWLERHGFAMPSVFVVQGSRGRIAAALTLDIVVDDRAENCLDVITDSVARPILVWRGDMDDVPETAVRVGIGVARSVADCLDVLVEADHPARGENIGDRVMRLLRAKHSGRRAAAPQPQTPDRI